MSLLGQAPELGNNVFVAPSANVIGNVKIGAQSSVWYGAVIRGDTASVSIGSQTNVQDNTIIHVTQHGRKTGGPVPVVIGDKVTIGHAVTLHGCTIEAESLVGMGATVLDGAVVEKHAMVAAGAVVTMGTRVPSGQVWAGSPAKYLRDLTPEEVAFLSQSAGNYVELAKTHMAENAKTFEEVERDKQLRRERGGFASVADLVASGSSHGVPKPVTE